MKLYALIHPFGSNVGNFNRGRDLCEEIRTKHPEFAVIYVLDNIVYEDEKFAHSEINKWCAEIVSRCDGIIVPEGWQESEGCQIEVEAAQKHGKEILFATELI